MSRLTQLSVTWLLLLAYAAGGVVASTGAVFCEEADGDTRVLLAGGCASEITADEAHCDTCWNPCVPCDSPCTDRPMVGVAADVPRTKNKASQPATQQWAPPQRPSSIALRTPTRITPSLMLFRPPASLSLVGTVVLNV